MPFTIDFRCVCVVMYFYEGAEIACLCIFQMYLMYVAPFSNVAPFRPPTGVM